MDKLEVVFHELLHFIFFDYCDSFLKEETKDLDKNKGVLWELSEIFNVIVLTCHSSEKYYKERSAYFILI
jgi:hypothetical protein